MGTWAEGDGQRYEAAGVDTSATETALVTASATAHTKGSYAQLIASTAFDAVGLYVRVPNTGSASALWLMDIAVGAAAAEQVIVPNILFQNSSFGIVGQWTFFEISIPAGSRLAARVQSDVASGQIRVACYLVGGGFAHPSPLSRVTAYGPNTATTRGAVIDPGGTVHTKGAYTEVTASMTNPVRVLVATVGYQKQTTLADIRWLMDIAIGAAGSEQVIIPNLSLIVASAFDEFIGNSLGPFSISIPAATRLAIRAQCSITTAAERDFDVALDGID